MSGFQYPHSGRCLLKPLEMFIKAARDVMFQYPHSGRCLLKRCGTYPGDTADIQSFSTLIRVDLIEAPGV